MRLKFRQSIASPAWSYRAGEVHDISAAEAEGYLKSGVAEPAEPEPEEAAVLPPEEMPTRPRARARRPASEEPS